MKKTRKNPRYNKVYCEVHSKKRNAGLKTCPACVRASVEAMSCDGVDYRQLRKEFPVIFGG